MIANQSYFSKKKRSGFKPTQLFINYDSLINGFDKA